ncbi:AAA family ATPase [Methyloversatilis sp.]|uniref:AAA family ATPase n=1 Tax=Methyloversatilis sp. TaxID=2569862 RepID=UPI00273664D2|nr:AAA family ATPase [Methyloversatilis sp.]MDP3457044.1 AAA family ATPase [Methyloversatilis sp.]
MQNLMTHQRYLELARTEMPNAFPWARRALLVMAPGHIEIVDLYLQSIESIVGTDELTSKLRFLRLTDSEERGLQICIDVNDISETMSSAVGEVGSSAIDSAWRACAACGQFVARGKRYCSAHVERSVLFAEDELGSSNRAARCETATNGNAPLSEPLSDQNAQQSVDAESLPHTPILKVFSDADVALLERSAEGKDSDTRDRIRGVVKRLRAAAGSKPLVMVPDNWRYVLEGFEADFPNFVEFVEFLRDRFALAELGDRSVDIPPVLFEGPPGIGKTEVARSLAALINTESMELDMATTQSGAALCGSEAFWSNTREGRFFEMLAYGKSANPLVFLDELDKVGGDDRYRPDAALYQLLEPRTAAAFRDLSIREMCIDASRVLWFAASNDLERVSPPIRSRFVVFNIPAPAAIQCERIAHSIYRHLLARNAWGTAMAPDISDEVAAQLGELPPRLMRILLSQACGRAARQGRRNLLVEDITIVEARPKHGIGFIR